MSSVYLKVSKSQRYHYHYNTIMRNAKPSLQQRLTNIIEDACAGCGGGGMTAGDGGFTGGADDAGPVAGYDPTMGKIDKIRKKRKNRIPQR